MCWRDLSPLGPGCRKYRDSRSSEFRDLPRIAIGNNQTDCWGLDDLERINPESTSPRHGDIDERAEDKEDDELEQAALHSNILRRCPDQARSRDVNDSAESSGITTEKRHERSIE